VLSYLHNAGRIRYTRVVWVQVAAHTGSIRARNLQHGQSKAAHDIAAGVGVAGGKRKAGGRDGGMAAAAAAAVPLGPLTGYLHALLQYSNVGGSCNALVFSTDSKSPVLLQGKVRGEGHWFLQGVAEEFVGGLHFDGQNGPVAKILCGVRGSAVTLSASATATKTAATIIIAIAKTKTRMVIIAITCKYSAFTAVLSAKFSSLETSIKTRIPQQQKANEHPPIYGQRLLHYLLAGQARAGLGCC
jgi:hypothetical protein